MKCGVCGNTMQQLFLSCVCDFCDSKPNTSGYHRGFVVWRGFLGPGFPHYVFSNQESAKRWSNTQGRNSGEVREVLSPEPFRWRPSRGSLQDIEFADHLFEIYEDHRYPQAPHRAFLSPGQETGVQAANAVSP